MDNRCKRALLLYAQIRQRMENIQIMITIMDRDLAEYYLREYRKLSNRAHIIERYVGITEDEIKAAYERA